MDDSLYRIENERLSVLVSATGAELQSVMCGGVERIWCGDPAVWPRRAPLLFPLIGRLRDGSYDLHGRPVAAPRHGFCRDRAFEAERLSETAVRFATSDDAGTREVFPFSFELAVEFSLEGNTLVKTHRVRNTGDDPMPFELGGHEAYAVRLLPGERMADYCVLLGDAIADDGLETGASDGAPAGLPDGAPEGLPDGSPTESPVEAPLDSIEAFDMDEEGILRLPKVSVPLRDGRLERTPEQLGLDTVVLEDVPGRTASLVCAKNGHAVTVSFPDFPYLGIWTAACGQEPRYLCLEPWSALPDAHSAPRELSEKPGVRTILPGREQTLTYRMTFR